MKIWASAKKGLSQGLASKSKDIQKNETATITQAS
jgi:hypothetical protein